MHILIVLYMGEVEFTKLCIDEDMSRIELADWCSNNWHDEDSDPDDFSTNDRIEWYFDHYEDYAFYRQPIQGLAGNKQGAMTQGGDIILTPGMCRIIREALGEFNFDVADIIVHEEEENDLGNGGEAIAALIQQFS